MKTRGVPLTHVVRDREHYRDRPELNVFRLLWRVFSYAKPYRSTFSWLMLHVLFRAALLPACTWAMAAVINGPIEHRDARGIVSGALAFAALVAFTNWMFRFRYRFALELGEFVIHDLRAAVFRHILRMPMSYFTGTKVGGIIGRVTSDIDSIRTGVQDVIFVSIVQFGQMLIAGALMFYYDWVLLMVVVVMGPIIWGLNQYFTKRIAEAQRKATESFSRISATLAESVSGVRVTQGFVRENLNAEYFRDLVGDQARYNLVSARTSAVFLPLLEFNTQLFTALLLLIGGWRVLGSGAHVPVGNIVQFVFLSTLFFEPVKNIGNQYTAALSAMVGAERVFRLLDTPPDWTDAPEAQALPVPSFREGEGGSGCFPGIQVEFRELWFAYETDRFVLRNINFAVAPGKTVALVGHTGSGKTSITNLLAKMYLPTRGHLILDGMDVMGIRSDSLHRQLGIVHQHSFLFEGSVLDNIRFACPEASDAQVVEITERLGFRDLIEGLSEGFLTQVGEGGAKLSVGQRQLVNFARAMMVNPRLLILDEATSSIDALTEARIQVALGRLLEGRTSFVVAHRLSTIRKADLILVLKDGEIVERGTHAELVGLGGIYAELNSHFVK